MVEAVLEAHHHVHPAPKERSELLDAFRVVDTNGDGEISGGEVPELVQMLTTMGEPLTDDEMEDFMQSIDEDGDGTITKTEFMQLLDSQGPEGEAASEAVT